MQTVETKTRIGNGTALNMMLREDNSSAPSLALDLPTKWLANRQHNLLISLFSYQSTIIMRCGNVRLCKSFSGIITKGRLSDIRCVFNEVSTQERGVYLGLMKGGRVILPRHFAGRGELTRPPDKLPPTLTPC